MTSGPTIPFPGFEEWFGAFEPMTRSLPFLLLAIVASAAERKPWTSSNVKGSPDPPPPYVAEQFWSHLQLNKVLDVAHLPSAGQIFLVGQKGKILSLPADLDAKEPQPVIFGDLSKTVPRFQNLYGMTFHPRHAENIIAGKNALFLASKPRSW